MNGAASRTAFPTHFRGVPAPGVPALPSGHRAPCRRTTPSSGAKPVPSTGVDAKWVAEKRLRRAHAWRGETATVKGH